MTKKILVDGREFVLGRRTGIGRFLEGLLLALTHKHPGWSVVLVLDEPKALPALLHGKVTVLQALSNLEWQWAKLAQGYDLFISPYPKLPVRKLPCPSIHTIHDVFYLTHPAYQGNILRTWLGTWRLKHACTTSTLTWFDSKVSQSETEKVVRKPSKNSAVRFPAIEQSFRPDRRIKKKDFFLFVGNGLPHKNVQVLLQAVQGTNVKLKCVGIKKHVADQLCASFELKKNQIEFLQGVDDKSLLKLYRQTKALLQPSTAEGYGYPPLEAMACGTQAIVSDIPVLHETTHGIATFCAPHDISAWQKALLHFECDEEAVAQGLDWAKAHQGDLGWEGHIKDIEKLVNA